MFREIHNPLKITILTFRFVQQDTLIILGSDMCEFGHLSSPEEKKVISSVNSAEPKQNKTTSFLNQTVQGNFT